jgi:hypothetical protein
MIDPLASFFNHIINEAGLVDISPTSLKPTWRNGRCGDFRISKRIDRFLVDDNLLSKIGRACSWTINSNIYDHNPIVMQLEEEGNLRKVPFKFNHCWLFKPDFILLVRSMWKSMVSWNDSSVMSLLARKLKNLKDVVINWKK